MSASTPARARARSRRGPEAVSSADEGVAYDPSIFNDDEEDDDESRPSRPASGYVRISKDDAEKIARLTKEARGQAIDDAINRQKKRILKKAAGRGDTIPEGNWYEDRSLSAWKPRVRRPEYERLLRDIKAGLVPRVYVFKLDRLVRQIREASRIKEAFEAGHGALISATEDLIDTTTISGRLLFYILVLVAEMESETMSLRLRGKHEGIATAGHWQGGPQPFGHVWVQADDGTRTLARDPDKATWVERAKAMLLDGATLRKIAMTLHDEGLRNSKGKPVTASVIRRWLISPRMIGRRDLTPHLVAPVGENRRRPKIKGAPPAALSEQTGGIEPLMTDEEWVRVLMLLNRERKSPAIHTRLLSGIVHCHACGKTLQGWSLPRGGGDGYTCLNTGPGSGCSKVSLPARPLDEAVASAVFDLLAEHDLASYLAKGSAEASSLVRDIEVLEVRLEAMAEDHYRRGKLSAPMFERLSGEIERDIAKLRGELDARYDRPALAKFAAADVAAAWGAATIDDRKALVRWTLDRAGLAIEIGPGHAPRAEDDPARARRPTRRLDPDERIRFVPASKYAKPVGEGASVPA